MHQAALRRLLLQPSYEHVGHIIRKFYTEVGWEENTGGGLYLPSLSFLNVAARLSPSAATRFENTARWLSDEDCFFFFMATT